MGLFEDLYQFNRGAEDNTSVIVTTMLHYSYFLLYLQIV